MFEIDFSILQWILLSVCAMLVGMSKTPECQGDLGTCPCTAGGGGPWPKGGGRGVLCANLGDFGVLFGSTRTENGEPPLNFPFLRRAVWY